MDQLDQQWEYDIETVDLYVAEPLRFLRGCLNARGRRGWELINMFIDPAFTFARCVYKRPLDQPLQSTD